LIKKMGSYYLLHSFAWIQNTLLL